MDFLRLCVGDVGAQGKISYLHRGRDIGSGAFSVGDKAQIEIQLPRYVGVVSACLEIWNESYTEKIETEPAVAENSDFLYDKLLIKLNTRKLGVGLYFFRAVVNTAWGRLYGYRSDSGISLSDNPFGNNFQLSVVDFKTDEPSRFFGGIIYHVFVDRFFKAGRVSKREDAVMIEDWDNGIPEYPEYPGAHLENNTFFGGTLWGVIEKLDYIKSLGTTLIYLSPIFEAYSNHKYDTGDYMKVDEMFGADEALERLIAEAKKRDIGIILDGVFNHTGADSVYFNRNARYKTLGAYQSKDSEYYKWYDFQSYPNKYTSWWGIKILPRINPDIKECGDFIAGDGGVIEKYARMGVAGFRLDVADELSDSFLARIKSKLTEVNRENILFGEVWEDASNKIAYDKRKRYYLGDELDAVMNYPVRTGIIEFLKNHNPSELKYALGEVIFNAPKRVRDLQMNLLGTHDTERILTVLAADSGEGKTNAELSVMKMTHEQRQRGISLLKMAYTILATIPGLPTIFYADEAGLEGYKDPFNRRPYPWSRINSDLLSHYRKIGKIRGEAEVYRDGDFKLAFLDEEKLVFARYKANTAYITVINNSEKNLTIRLSKRARALVSERVDKDITIPKYSSEIIKTTANETFEII